MDQDKSHVSSTYKRKIKRQSKKSSQAALVSFQVLTNKGLGKGGNEEEEAESREMTGKNEQFSETDQIQGDEGKI